MKDIMLNGAQKKELHNALMDAFPENIQLEKMLLFEMDKYLERIAGSSNLSDSVYQVIKAAQAEGWLEDLAFAAHDSNPGNQLLLSFLRQFCLKSERNIDYTKLRNFLKAGQWEEADEETYRVMLQAVGHTKDDYIRSEELLNFPCTDLRTIDHLWVKYKSIYTVVTSVVELSDGRGIAAIQEILLFKTSTTRRKYWSLD
ncbi:GUN4 domain-containing protein [Aetokthonos hydrillicola Thurmond2011]|jgi:hypothetical protein|uniref:GUN4 domain-containing protein n=2 Tax=Aetokthonos TaxID=1550243 RepID=A0AAP5ICF1_9CYAN|nr:GUN4 domain-containing protein [Aetokthonos hydrillicola]MBO3463269.1 GUN4 domain-containing protein [Aetokthonos hydrillicola CCALA 1050]MBW4590506.1 GUN4 domain-containing protein [Aetokthonos hydrillicola CCALA 1050]MDR9899020.1 GUN4 domain-containing protein [Aetokthonos hydrillicola Thurmond2011]